MKSPSAQVWERENGHAGKRGQQHTPTLHAGRSGPVYKLNAQTDGGRARLFKKLGPANAATIAAKTGRQISAAKLEAALAEAGLSTADAIEAKLLLIWRRVA
jgi:hypothetical protein